jgi:hypothetical protein
MKKMNKILLAAAFLFVGSSLFAQDAKVIVYRKGCLYGSLANFKVNVDGKNLSTLKSKDKFEFNLAPGSHLIGPKQEPRQITLDVKPNQTYYVKYRTMIGLFGARPSLKIMTADEAKEESKMIMKKTM